MTVVPIAKMHCDFYDNSIDKNKTYKSVLPADVNQILPFTSEWGCGEI